MVKAKLILGCVIGVEREVRSVNSVSVVVVCGSFTGEVP